MSLKSNIANWVLSGKSNNSLSKKFVNWNHLKKLMVVCYDNQLSNIVDFINTCHQQQIESLVVIVFDGKPEQAPKPNFSHIILDKKQFDFFGIPHQETVNQLSVFNSDVIINLGNSNQFKSLAISKLVNAKCKIASFEQSVFDIIISVDKTNNTFEFLKQVIVYLQMIKTIN
jgi:uncharacterized Rmd1/YagE family protein